MSSQNNIGKQGSVGEYNANNAWLYNGNNGTLNNNNKYNSNGVRPVLESAYATFADLEGCFVKLSDWYGYCHICKRRKTNKPSYLIYYYDMARQNRQLCYDVGNCEYIQKEAICFVITYPRLREVIAADFTDRMVQTYFVKRVIPLLEERVLHSDSYACRVGKGGLKAIQKLQEYVYEESNGYTNDVWIAKIDLKGFFMSIDTDLSVQMLSRFIQDNVQDEAERNMLLYLCRIIYQSLPQMHCVVKSPQWMFDALPDNKKLLGKATYQGVAIGNVTSQMMACYITTPYLNMLSKLGYKFVHYTDDTCVVVKDKLKWLQDIKLLERYVSDELHLTTHPDKRYFQHYSKGVEMLGYKLRYNRILPSDRIAHNFRWKVDCAIRKANRSKSYMYSNLEHFVQVVNSYLGLLMWCNAYGFRKEMVEKIKLSNWCKVLYFAEDYHKVNIKPSKTRVAWYVRKNAERKKYTEA